MDGTGAGFGAGGGMPDGDDPQEQAEAPLSAFNFEGTWREFAPIAFTNLLLTIVTLGIYRFWATTRERRYLWSRSRFIDEHLEWTGVGKELFFGFLMVAVLFGIPFLVLQFVVEALMLQGYPGAGAAVMISMFLLIFYLSGVARFRALRYRLGRTHWRGIRGGSYEPGFKYGLSYMWKYTVGYLAMGLMVPWAMMSLWNERWGHMTFGQMRFSGQADFSPLMKRYLLAYLAPFIILALVFVAGVAAALGLGMMEEYEPDNPASATSFMWLFILGMLAFYLLWGLAYLLFYAKYMRVVIGEMRLGDDISFGFSASTKDWFKLIMGDVGLVVVTLGIGWIFLSYRHWKFFITHLEAYGVIDPDALMQSDTPMAKHGEGLLDAFDMGAI